MRIDLGKDRNYPLIQHFSNKNSLQAKTSNKSKGIDIN